MRQPSKFKTFFIYFNVALLLLLIGGGTYYVVQLYSQGQTATSIPEPTSMMQPTATPTIMTSATTPTPTTFLATDFTPTPTTEAGSSAQTDTTETPTGELTPTPLQTLPVTGRLEWAMAAMIPIGLVVLGIIF